MTEVTRRNSLGGTPRVGARGKTTRRKILDASLSVFDEHGFHATRIEFITTAAGVSRPSYYQYFSSKEEVFWTLAGELAKKLSKLSDSLVDVDSGRDGVEQIEKWLYEMIELYHVYAGVFSSFPAATGGPSASTHGPQIVAKRLGLAINSAIDLPDPSVPEAAGSIAEIVTLRSIHFWRTGLGQISLDRFVNGHAQTLHRLIHGPNPDVNIGPVALEPAKTQPSWPSFVVDGQQVRRPRGQATHQRLLDAGIQALHRGEYHEIHIDDIVAEAGVSHGSFYHHFASKDALFQELAETAANSVAGVIALFPEQIDHEHLHAWLTVYYACYRVEGAVISVWQEIAWESDELSRYSLDVALAIFDRLQGIVARRGFGDCAVDALALLALIERVPHNTHALQYASQNAAIEASAFLLQRALLGQSAEQR